MSHYTRKPILSIGFTLLELLVALAIFSVISAVAYQSLNSILTVREHTEHEAKQLAAIQMAMMRLGQDIQLYVDRTIRDEYGETQPSIQGQIDYISFTRIGWHNPLKQQRSNLQRVSYYLKANKLIRVYWRILDRAQDSQSIESILFTEVDALTFRFLDESFKWHTQWPPTDTAPTEFSQIPLKHSLHAVEITLNTTLWGKITRLFAISSQMPTITEETQSTTPTVTDSFVKIEK